MIRSQEEIIERFKIVEDLFGVQQADLIEFAEFENAKQFLTKSYIEDIESGVKVYELKTDAKECILNYLDFAYDKAENKRGLSAARSMYHFKTWIWLDNEDFYNELISELENYTDYGIAVLDKISEHYGYKRT